MCGLYPVLLPPFDLWLLLRYTAMRQKDGNNSVKKELISKFSVSSWESAHLLVRWIPSKFVPLNLGRLCTWCHNLWLCICVNNSIMASLLLTEDTTLLNIINILWILEMISFSQNSLAVTNVVLRSCWILIEILVFLKRIN